MHSDEQPARPARPDPDRARRQLVSMAGDAQRGGRAATDLYLALLQDRLPVYPGRGARRPRRLRARRAAGRPDAGRRRRGLGRQPAVGGCLSYALTRLLMGEDDLPPRDAYAAGLVQALRVSA